MDSTRKLANFASRTRYEDLPENVVERTKMLILDAIGCAIGGYPLKTSKIFVGLAKEMGSGASEATIIGDGAKVNSPMAALANNAMSVALDYSDFFPVPHAKIWPASSSVPAALAVGESNKSSGRELITAVALGCEVASRIADSMVWSPAQAAKVIGASATIFAPTIASAKLLHLNEDEILSAMGMAGVYAPVPAVRKFIGKNIKPMREVKQAWAWIGMTGVFVAISAQRGLKMLQKEHILEGSTGFWVMQGADKFRERQLTTGLGKKYTMLNSATKNHPSVFFAHAPIDVVNCLVEEHGIDVKNISKIVVKMGSNLSLVTNDHSPEGEVDAQFSVPYQVAVSLLEPDEGPKWYSDKTLSNPEILQLARRVTSVFDREADNLFITTGESMVKGEIITKDKKVYRKNLPSTKIVSTPDEYRRKFSKIAAQVLPQDHTSKILRIIDNIEDVDDITQLIDLLHPVRQ